MSFVRMPRRSQSLSGRSKKQTQKKPTWDDTTSDLTVHKLNQDEIDRRHKVHQSNNLDAIKDEKRRRALLKAKKQRSLSEGNQAGLLREILYEEQQLNAALAHSDRVMAVVKDLFYDDPKRLKAVPHITRAPAGHGDKRAGGPIAEGPTHTSYLDTLSESVMDPSALNDYQEEEEEESDSDDSGESADEGDQYVLDTRLNIGHRRKVIDEMADQHVNEGNADPQGRCGDKENLDPSKTPDRQNTALSQQRAINDTAKVKKKARSRSKGKGHQCPQLNITQKTTPEDLTMLLNELMTACSAFDESRVGVGGESSAGHLSPSPTSTSSSSVRGFPQLSGYTAFLVQTLTRILTHLTQNEARLREQAAERRRLEEEVSQQRQLIDAMTVDSLQSQELNMQIQTEARKQIQQLELRLQVVEHLLVNQDLGESDHPQPFAENKPDVPVKDSHLKIRGAASPAELQKTAANTLPPSIPAQQGTDDVKPGATVSMGHPGGLQGASANKTLAGQGRVVRLDQTVGVNGMKPMSSVHPSVTAKPPAMDAIMRGVRGNVVGGTGSSQPHLSQHTLERMRSLSGNSTDNEPQTTNSQGAALLQRHPRSDGAHQDRMMRPVQTNLPRGVEILGSRTSQNIGWSVDGVSSMHKQGGLSKMPSDLYAGGGNLGSRTQEKLPGAFGASSEERELDEGLSHDGHLAPLQPAMLLSPPRQKDRRDFIKPPGYLQQTSHNHRPALAHRNYPSQHEQHTLGKGKIFPNYPQTAGSEIGKHQQQHPTSLHTGVPQHSLSLESQHPPQHPLFNNYTDGQAHVGDHERALSTMSADSSSTRYLSLPGDTRDTRLVRSLLQPAGQGAGQGGQGRMCPNGQDHPRARLAQAGGHLVSMVTLPEASLNGTAEGDGAADDSVDLNDKIATLSRQRVEAQARLQQLQDTYGSSGRAGEAGSTREAGRAVGLNTASQRPTTSGAEATNQVQPSGSYNRNTAALVGASPPISPIGRTPPTHRPMTTGTSHVASEGRTIHVAMPRVHELEISATSTPASKRTSLGSGGPSPGLDQHDWKTPIKDSPGQDQFFALKAHVSS